MEGGYEDLFMDEDRMLCQPEFWRALAKAMNWLDMEYQVYTKDRVTPVRVAIWLRKASRLIAVASTPGELEKEWRFEMELKKTPRCQGHRA